MAAEAEPNDQIYVSNLPEGTDDDTLKSTFEAYGTVIWHKVMNGKEGMVGLVQFSSVEEAANVVELSDTELFEDGSTTFISFAKKSGHRNKGAGKGKVVPKLWPTNEGGLRPSSPYGAGAKASGNEVEIGATTGGPIRVIGKLRPHRATPPNIAPPAALLAKTHNIPPGKGSGKAPQVGSVRKLKQDLKAAGKLMGGDWRDWTPDGELFVGGLPHDTTNEDVYEIFASYGAIPARGVKAMMKEGYCSGIAFVNFLDPEHAQAAIDNLNGVEVSPGRNLVVKLKAKKNKGEENAEPEVIDE